MKHTILLAVLGTALLLSAGCAKNDDQTESAAAKGKGRLNVYNWTEYIPEDVLEDFEKETSIRLVYDNYGSNEEMYAKLKAGGSGYDVTFPSQDFIPLMIEEDMLKELDLSQIPNFAGIDPAILQRNSYDPGNRYSVPYSFGTTAIVYWKDRVQNVKDSWAVLERPDLKGKVVLMDDMREVLGAALRYLGYSVNTTSPQEINEARNLVNVWKKNVVKFDNDIISSGFATREFSLVFIYPENALAEVDPDDMDKVGILFPKEGGAMYLDSMVILKNAKNLDNAYTFINFILRPDIYARIMDAFGYPGLVPGAQEYRTTEPLYTSEDLPNSEFRLDVGPAIELYNKAWQEIRVGL